jgi:hypothetical protein
MAEIRASTRNAKRTQTDQYAVDARQDRTLDVQRFDEAENLAQSFGPRIGNDPVNIARRDVERRPWSRAILTMINAPPFAADFIARRTSLAATRTYSLSGNL